MTDPSKWKPLSPAFTAALRKYEQGSRARLHNFQTRNAIMAPLYHYTNRGGLEGIITAQQFWYTHHQHLNDQTELQFGMEVANGILAELGTRSPKVKLFCDMVIDLFSAKNMSTTFGFYIASFSRSRDDAHQWRKYGQNGQGFAIGLAPKLFAIEDKPNRQPQENVFALPVRYGSDAARTLHLPAIESAARIVSETVERKVKAMSDINRGMPFFDRMAKTLLASELILNCLVAKDLCWMAEQEVRQFILGENSSLAPYVSLRGRGAETVPSVPYIKGNMPLRQPGGIAEIIIGPTAPSDSEDFICSLLENFHNNPRSIISKSTQYLPE